jgi:catechol 2,3-dioxygenase-like lactoylglutathione lyase family enzyme
VSTPSTERLAVVAPEMFVRDVDASIAFYIKAFGFQAVRVEPTESAKHYFAVLGRGEVEFLFMQENFYLKPAGGRIAEYRGSGVDVRVMVDDVDAVYEHARAAGAEIVHAIGDRDYALRDFIVSDPDGFRIRFAQRVA